MELIPLESASAPAETDWAAMEEEAWGDIFAAKIGLAQMLILRVVFRYSLRLGRASAWIPDLGVFEMHTEMKGKEVREALDKLVSYRMLEVESAPAVDLLPQGQFPYGMRYKYFPRSTRGWSIAPRVTKQQLKMKAASIDRWLLAFNAGGDPAQADLFPPLWDHADTLAEWRVSSEDPPQVRPDARAEQSEQPPNFRLGSVLLNPGEEGVASEDELGEKPQGDRRGLGKNPMGLGEKPHGPINDWNDFNERHVSHSKQSKPLMDGLGKNPEAEEAAENETRPAHWPPIAVERALLKRVFALMDAWYAPEAAAAQKKQWGGLWRTRIRMWPFAVEYALESATRQWKEMYDLGKFLNREWKRTWKKRAAKTQGEIDGNKAAPLPAGTDLRAAIAASLGEGEEGK